MPPGPQDTLDQKRKVVRLDRDKKKKKARNSVSHEFYKHSYSDIFLAWHGRYPNSEQELEAFMEKRGHLKRRVKRS